MATISELEDHIADVERTAQRALDLIPLKARGHIRERHIHRIIDGQGFLAYDSFTRDDSTTVGTSESGHTWVEEEGDWEISSNGVRVKTLNAGGDNTVITLDVGSQDVGSIRVKFTTASTATNIDVGIVFRFIDDDNFMLLQLVDSTTQLFRLMKHEGGSFSSVESITYSPSASTGYVMGVDFDGPVVRGNLWLNTTGASVAHVIDDIPSDTFTPFVGATKVGLRHHTLGGAGTDRFDTFVARLGNAVATSQVTATTHGALTGVTSSQHHTEAHASDHLDGTDDIFDDATSDPLIDADSASDGTEQSTARKDHVHPKHHAQAHGPSQHTEGNADKALYLDSSGDEQEVALVAGGSATLMDRFFRSSSATGAPDLKEIEQGVAITIETPVADDNITIYHFSQAVTIREVHALVTGGTSVTFNLYMDATRTTETTKVWSSDKALSAGTTATRYTPDTAAIAADDFFFIDISAISGTPTELFVKVRFTTT